MKTTHLLYAVSTHTKSHSMVCLSQDGALSQTPTITTYKAVKRSASTPSGSAPNQTAPPASKRPQGSSSSSTTTPERVPSSVRNIQKLSTQADITVLQEGRKQEPEEVETNNNPAHGLVVQ